MKGLKYVETLKITFIKMSDGEIVHKTAYFNRPAETIINNVEINESLQMSKQTILNKIAVWISDGSGWTVQSVDTHYLNVVKCQPIRGSPYIQLPAELRNSAKGLINIKIRIMNVLDGVTSDTETHKRNFLNELKNLIRNTLTNWITLELNSQ